MIRTVDVSNHSPLFPYPAVEPTHAEFKWRADLALNVTRSTLKQIDDKVTESSDRSAMPNLEEDNTGFEHASLRSLDELYPDWLAWTALGGILLLAIALGSAVYAGLLAGSLLWAIVSAGALLASVAAWYAVLNVAERLDRAQDGPGQARTDERKIF